MIIKRCHANHDKTINYIHMCHDVMTFVVISQFDKCHVYASMLFALMRSSFMRHDYNLEMILRHIFNHMISSQNFNITLFFFINRIFLKSLTMFRRRWNTMTMRCDSIIVSMHRCLKLIIIITLYIVNFLLLSR